VRGGQTHHGPRSRRSRRAHSSAMTLVGSETTSVPRTVDTTLFWLA
jgi:hypothetical protein